MLPLLLTNVPFGTHANDNGVVTDFTSIFACLQASKLGGALHYDKPSCISRQVLRQLVLGKKTWHLYDHGYASSTACVRVRAPGFVAFSLRWPEALLALRGPSPVRRRSYRGGRASGCVSSAMRPALNQKLQDLLQVLDFFVMIFCILHRTSEPDRLMFPNRAMLDVHTASRPKHCGCEMLNIRASKNLKTSNEPEHKLSICSTYQNNS